MNQMQQNEGFEPIDHLIALSGPIECIDTGAIDQEELLSHARGAALSPAAQAHLDECGYCTNLLAEYRNIAVEPTRIGRWPFFAAMTGLAAAASLFFMLATTTQIATYHVAEISGAVQQDRGSEKQEGLIFAPNSQVKVILTPDTASTEPLKVQVFGIGVGGRLQPATVEVNRNEDGQFLSYSISGTGKDLFGTERGNRQIAIHLASSKVEPIGLTLEAARTKYEGQWLVIDAHYLGLPE